MKNKKIILMVFILILGLSFIFYGVFEYKENSNKNKGNNIEKINENGYDPNSYNEYRDLAGLDKDLIIQNFNYKNIEKKCEFSFTLINNKDEDINNKLLKVNFYNKTKQLLNTFEFNIEYLGIHDKMDIKYFVEINEEADIFDYEFENITKELIKK